jgi:hypothetical protein
MPRLEDARKGAPPSWRDFWAQPLRALGEAGPSDVPVHAPKVRLKAPYPPFLIKFSRPGSR